MGDVDSLGPTNDQNVDLSAHDGRISDRHRPVHAFAEGAGVDVAVGLAGSAVGARGAAVGVGGTRVGGAAVVGTGGTLGAVGALVGLAMLVVVTIGSAVAVGSAVASGSTVFVSVGDVAGSVFGAGWLGAAVMVG